MYMVRTTSRYIIIMNVMITNDYVTCRKVHAALQIELPTYGRSFVIRLLVLVLVDGYECTAETGLEHSTSQ